MARKRVCTWCKRPSGSVSQIKRDLFNLSQEIQTFQENMPAEQFLSRCRTITAEDDQFFILRGWNSWTPSISGNYGGGYYLIRKNMGIVIDPGYSFITLFLESGRPDRGVSVEDIDYLIVTHDHPDHCDELPRIITLLFEFNDRHNSEHKIEIITSYGVYFKYRELFENREVREVINVQRKLPGATINFPDEYDMKLKCLRARHKELLGDETSFGLKFTLSPSSSNPFTLCITGDTKFDARLVQQYEDADLLVAHIGSMEEIGAKTYYFKSHLGFCGVVDLLKKLHKKPKLTLISEWGEEFMSRRYETTKLIEAFSQVQPVLPADTHLCVRIRDGNLGFLEDVPGQPIRRRFAPPNQVSIDDMGSKLIYK